MNNIENIQVTPSSQNFSKLQCKLGYTFSREHLLFRSLVHRSYLYEHRNADLQDNETLEFLGDAVLDLVIAALLFRNYPQMTEGEMTKLRSALVKADHLATVARSIDLGEFLMLGKGEDASGGREKDSLLSCVYEAVIGAVFVDGGYEAACKVVEAHFKDRVEANRNTVSLADAKSHLQELTQHKYNEAPLYHLDSSEGPDHDRLFKVSVHFRGSVLGSATAKSKKMAEQKAAALAIVEFVNGN